FTAPPTPRISPLSLHDALPISQTLERRRSAELIYRALDGLADHYRTVFILFEIEGLSGEKIAELTNTRVATVWVRLNRAGVGELDRKSTRLNSSHDQISYAVFC